MFERYSLRFIHFTHNEYFRLFWQILHLEPVGILSIFEAAGVAAGLPGAELNSTVSDNVRRGVLPSAVPWIETVATLIPLQDPLFSC